MAKANGGSKSKGTAKGSGGTGGKGNAGNGAADGLPAVDLRHTDAKRKNNPPAQIAAEGVVPVIAKPRYEYNPHLPPVLRFDQHGKPDALPELLAKARSGPLSEEETQVLAAALRNQEPWLEWTGKREKKAFEVDPVALHIHERVSARAILKVAARQDVTRDLFADPEQEYHEAVQFYKHDVDWSNRLILGDSLQVMSSLARREDLAGKVQMIYMDPPYGIKFASNFQPEVGKRDVKDKQEDLTREPEMVRAYRDTWHLGIHSYLSYLRDRLITARELLADTGSIFVQISDENIGLVRQLLDEVFGRDNFVAQINFKSMGALGQADIPKTFDYLLWFSRDRAKLKFRPVFRNQSFDNDTEYKFRDDAGRIYRRSTLTSSGFTKSCTFPFESNGRMFSPFSGKSWRTNADGMKRLVAGDRVFVLGDNIYFKRFAEDFSVMPYDNSWADPPTAFVRDYVVQTPTKFVERCMLMTTDPGDLVLDPTCGSGTTAYVAEQWGRRWITTDTSRVAIAIARQRLLTAKFDHYRTKDSAAGSGGISGGRAAFGAPSQGFDGAKKASNAPSQAWDGATQARDGAKLARDGAKQASSGAKQAFDGATQARDGAHQASDRANQGSFAAPKGSGGDKIGVPGSGTGSGLNHHPAPNPALGFLYRTVPHITLKSIAQNVALDPIFAKHEPILKKALAACNAALAKVPKELLARLASKLAIKERHEGKRAVTDADRRRWVLPSSRHWNHWEVPFDTDPEYPKDLAAAVTGEGGYRAAWRAKMDDVNACIAASAEQEELVDQPEVMRGITRVSGPFTVEGVQPPEMALADEISLGEFGGVPDEMEAGFTSPRMGEPRNTLEVANIAAYLDQMTRFLKADGVRFLGNKQMRWTSLNSLADSGTSNPFHAEGRWTEVGKNDPDPDGRANVAVAFGPQYGPITSKMVVELMRAALKRGYDHLVLAAFNFDGAAQAEVDANPNPHLKIHMAHIRPDINPGMDGLLKESVKAGGGQLFTVFGQPRVSVSAVKESDGRAMFTVTMEGVDVYNPVDDSVISTGAAKVAAWFLDSDYDGTTFCITQAFFPDKSAWEKLQKALNGKDGPIDAERFEALSGTTSLPFPAGEHNRVAVKVIDPRGNEAMVVEKL